MNNRTLHWQCTSSKLVLSGKLDRDTLMVLWQQRKSIMTNINTIDVRALERVDSAGLALLVHLREIVRMQGDTLIFTGITDKLQSLIILYNLQQIIVSEKETISL
ncbi:lipid asymmetry maintenance protein MlaB [Pantoea sp. Mhis]|uniref:lipid asymmetry maintenance protein MlaB n=1 Tax=Pantoea sp. Mhis TaxID=2576759 RepID=UPI00135A05EF|nr:lipid asymmetry maintenance protein MlaB [Pantoea sp. Mhis]MXP56434.1 lipid asymmetry maintenance protein MlaB [Pantoea sp. Mhis]